MRKIASFIDPKVGLGSLVNTLVTIIAFCAFGYAWVSTKDRNDVDLAAAIRRQGEDTAVRIKGVKDDLSRAIDDVGGQVREAKGQIAAVQTTASGLDKNLSLLAQEVSTLDERVDLLSEGQAGLGNRVGDLDTRVGVLEAVQGAGRK